MMQSASYLFKHSYAHDSYIVDNKSRHELVGMNGMHIQVRTCTINCQYVGIPT